jgi:hypothetical protein
MYATGPKTRAVEFLQKIRAKHMYVQNNDRKYLNDSNYHLFYKAIISDLQVELIQAI